MKIQVEVKGVEIMDIGHLDKTLRLPTSARIKNGMKTKCFCCGKDITDAFFIGGFKKGMPNMMFHEACCPETEQNP